MDGRIAIQPDQARALIQAMLNLEFPTLETPALRALTGQAIGATFEGQGPGGAKLRLDTGQALIARGDVPFPAGTALTLRIQQAVSGTSDLLVKILEARPPAPSQLLAPLLQGEANALTFRLASSEPTMAPLLRILKALGDAAPPPSLPAQASVETLLSRLPREAREALARGLNLPPESTDTALASALLAELESAHGTETVKPLLLQSARTGLPASIDRMLERIQREMPLSPKLLDRLTTLLKTLVGHTSSTVAPSLASHASKAETWETWMRATMTNLSDPASSPREAPFHSFQAQEGTAFFELPIPWAGAGTLQIWVEEDGEKRDRQEDDAPLRRVLLGLKFSSLGETRIGLMSVPGHLSARIWAEHSAALISEESQIRSELEALGSTVDLSIYSLEPGPGGDIPSLRALLTGSSLNALG